MTSSQPRRSRRTRPGKRNPTIQQVAERAAVSTATVSRVLDGFPGVSDTLVKRVQEAVRVLDYHPNRAARSLRKRVAQAVGVVISDIQNPFFTSVIIGIEQVLHEANYTLLLCNSDEDPRRERAHLATLRSEGVAGIILASTRTETDFYRLLAHTGTPVVAIDRTPDQQDMDMVTVTNQSGAYQAVAHLAGLGHRRIALVSGPLEISTSRERLEGYQAALRDCDIPALPELTAYGNYRQPSGYQAMQTLLSLPERPTAVLVANNLMTLGALQAIYEQGLCIPEQMALVGFDEMPWATSLQTPLTVVAQPTNELGATAAQLLLDRLREPDRPYQHVVLETRLIVRASCGATSCRGRIG